MQNAYLVFDIGTGNTRVALVGEDGAILDIAKENTRMYTDPIVSRAQYFKPQEWQDAVFSSSAGFLPRTRTLPFGPLPEARCGRESFWWDMTGKASSAIPTQTAAARASCRS